MNDARVYLTNLTSDAEPGMRSIASRPPERIIFVQRIDGMFHRWEGTLTVDQLHQALAPLLEHTEKPTEPS